MDAHEHPGWPPLPELIRPMLAVPGTLPPDGEWVFELKWDGVRAVVYADGAHLRALSRNDREITVSYPELHSLGNALAGTQVIVDGELVAFDQRGVPNFATLQNRMHVADPKVAQRLADTIPVAYVIFDVLHLDGQSLLREPYDNRRELLEQLELSGPSWQTAPVFTESGADVLAASRAQGMEGVVAKQRSSRYEPGRRSQSWRKIKHFRTQEVVIGGWRPGNGRRANTIGSLMMGVPDNDGLRYIGQVGTGFSDALLTSLQKRLTALARASSPFDRPLPNPIAGDARWCEPQIVGEVAFAEWTPDGLLRQPAWRGLRPDKSPDEVVRE